jgi:acetylornithine deacetylase/succinyl-diaminopimelate desuccinylase-like protein
MPRLRWGIAASLVALAAGAGIFTGALQAQSNDTLSDANKELAHSIYKQLIEINTTDSVGSTTVAAEAMAKRLRDAGFPASDVQVLGPNDRKGNMVARIHGTGAKKPILFICHLDVVEAKREDWSMDPFTFTEKDGYFYGRGTGDIKDGDAILMATFIRLKKENYKPDRDLILALTADEEGGSFNGVEWLLKNHRDLIDAEFILNPDAGGFELDKGKHTVVGIQAAEKMYQDYELKVTNPGGHSSLPTSSNAIYELANALVKLQRFQFPLELTDVTRAYFERESPIVGGQVGDDMKAILSNPPDHFAVDRLSAIPYYNARLRTTCVATRLDGGHANNALPAMAKANVNCRVIPGHSPDEIQATLTQVIEDPAVTITQVKSGTIRARTAPPSPLRPDVMGALESVSKQMWPEAIVIPVMDAGASDGAISRGFGIPTYGVPGVFMDIDDDRSHGRDERIRVSAFYEGLDFYYRFTKALSSAQ